jgi:hypothetical protein
MRGIVNNRMYGLLCAFGVALAVFGWQAATVHFNYGGAWSALFMSGDYFPAPPELAADTYMFKGSVGYDGQFCRYVAHDPWMRADWTAYYDGAVARHQRILVPLVAWLIGAGNPRWIDGAYIGSILIWIFLGTYLLARFVAEAGHHPAWGLAFALLPATLTSIDRMTVDVALAALCVAFLRCSKNQSRRWLYVVLVLAPLVRETGALLVAAECLYQLAARHWRRAALFATTMIPAAAWYIYLSVQRVPSVRAGAQMEYAHVVPHWLFRASPAGIVRTLFHPVAYPFGAGLNLALRAADALALVGFLTLAALAVWSLRERPWDTRQWAMLGFVSVVFATSAPPFWVNVYSYARPLSPLVLFAAIGALRCRQRWVLVPLVVLTLRVAVQLAPQALGIVRGL